MHTLHSFCLLLYFFFLKERTLQFLVIVLSIYSDVIARNSCYILWEYFHIPKAPRAGIKKKCSNCYYLFAVFKISSTFTNHIIFYYIMRNGNMRGYSMLYLEYFTSYDVIKCLFLDYQHICQNFIKMWELHNLMILE